MENKLTPQQERWLPFAEEGLVATENPEWQVASSLADSVANPKSDPVARLCRGNSAQAQ
jgi:hypothetical protein